MLRHAGIIPHPQAGFFFFSCIFLHKYVNILKEAVFLTSVSSRATGDRSVVMIWLGASCMMAEDNPDSETAVVYRVIKIKTVVRADRSSIWVINNLIFQNY